MISSIEPLRVLSRHKPVNVACLEFLQVLNFMYQLTRKKVESPGFEVANMALTFFNNLVEEDPPYVHPIANESWKGLVEPQVCILISIHIVGRHYNRNSLYALRRFHVFISFSYYCLQCFGEDKR